MITLTQAEVQAVADTDPIALRTLLLPAYDHVAVSFAGLLRGVVHRCRWDGQASGLETDIHDVYRRRTYNRYLCICDGEANQPAHRSVFRDELQQQGGVCERKYTSHFLEAYVVLCVHYF